MLSISLSFFLSFFSPSYSFRFGQFDSSIWTILSRLNGGISPKTRCTLSRIERIHYEKYQCSDFNSIWFDYFLFYSIFLSFFLQITILLPLVLCTECFAYRNRKSGSSSCCVRRHFCIEKLCHSRYRHDLLAIWWVL